MGCNAYFDYYTVPNVRETCHAVKQDQDLDLQRAAIIQIASTLASTGLADNAAYLIPAPQHTGFPIYTKEIAEIIASETKAHVLDIVRCKPCEPLYERKIRGEKGTSEFFLVGEYPKNGMLVFIDNVISSGSTYRAINELFDQDLMPLVYAVDYATLKERKPFDLIEQIKKHQM